MRRTKRGRQKKKKQEEEQEDEEKRSLLTPRYSAARIYVDRLLYLSAIVGHFPVE